MEKISPTKNISYRELTDDIITLSKHEKSSHNFYKKIKSLKNIKFKIRAPEKLWTALFFLFKNPSNETSINTLFEFTENNTTLDLSIPEILLISASLMRASAFDLALSFRDSAQKLALEAPINSIFSNENLFAYHIASLYEKGDYNRIESTIIESKKSNLMSDKYYRKEEQIRGIFSKTSKKKSCEFSDFIRNKSIAVVSPAHSLKLDGDEIDSYDLVVKCNHRINSSREAAIKGKRCDISYYSTAIANYIEEYSIDIDNLISWQVYKSESFINSKYSLHPRKRSTTYFDYIFFTGSLTAIPNLLIDLITHGAGKIKVFHADLMTTYKRTLDYDPIKGSNGLEKFNNSIRDFSHHDPFTQFNLIKALKDNKLIDTDRELEKIISSGIKEFSRTLNESYAIKNHQWTKL
ncbi:MAG: hypothetical protein ACK4L8_02415 [Nitrincola lacisaponensis]|uniref:hypothetical protein n=1 Tax=Nitrincola lacisaponensis TaxID=267850 RepID=UPI00391C4483